MIPSNRKRLIAARLRQIARDLSQAREWPAIAAEFDKLADALDRNLTASDDTPKSDKAPR